MDTRINVPEWLDEVIAKGAEAGQISKDEWAQAAICIGLLRALELKGAAVEGYEALTHELADMVKKEKGPGTEAVQALDAKIFEAARKAVQGSR